MIVRSGARTRRPRSVLVALAGVLLVLLAGAPPAASWGTQVHPHLNRLALRDLPDAVRAAMEAHAAEVVGRAAAADLGHYVADANVPLHTTENFNGQKSGNTGARALFEEVLVEAFWRDQYFTPAPAHLLAAAFDTITASYARIAPFLSAMTKAQERYARTDPRFYETLWADAGSVVTASMNQAAHDIASFWLAAWERAGRPRLPGTP